MLPIIAESALEFALLLCVVQMFAYKMQSKWQRACNLTVFLGVIFAFAVLVYSFAISDFSLQLVFSNSHTQKPLIYKISGTWGNHEGSMLLFITCIAAYSLLLRGDAKAVSGMAGLQGLFLAFLLYTSSPFKRLPIAPAEGMGLNPLLQDVGLAFHPPLLYLGYTGFAAVFALAVAVLIRGKLQKADLQLLRKVAIVAWSFLTVGITLGSWWAYRELGWGGFWFWDPVENSSLVPWFLATALVHSIVVVEKKGVFKKWVLLLSILTFLSCIAGFFLVRSGILSSVHAFAVDPERGYFILAILCAAAFPAFIIYGAKSDKFESKGDYPFWSRESAIQFNNLLTIVVSATVFIGTIFPFVLDLATGEKIAVGEVFYNQAVVPVLLIVVALAFVTLIVLQKGRFSLSVNLRSPMFLAHVGLVVMAIGIFASGVFSSEKLLQLKVGEKVEFAGKEFKFGGLSEGAATNYVFRRGLFMVDGHMVSPESRIYPIERQETTEAAIHTSYLSDYYVVIGAKNNTDQFAVRLYFKPLINLIWLGALLMFAGGAVRFAKLVRRK